MASDLHGQCETRAAASWSRWDSNRGDGDATISVDPCWWVGRGRSGSPARHEHRSFARRKNPHAAGPVHKKNLQAAITGSFAGS